MIVTKTLSTTLSNGVYPATYTWSSDCDSNLTYSNKTGTVNSNGTLTTTISYNDTTCLQCNFYISVIVIYGLILLTIAYSLEMFAETPSLMLQS